MSETTAVARISRARQLLAEARDLTDIKAIRDMAVAAAEYARAVKAGAEAIREAEEVKVRAERLAGEALKIAPKHPGHRFAGDVPGASPAPTLAEQGISGHQSQAWQDVAALPAEDFEAEIAQRKAQRKPITTKALAKKGREHKQAASAQAMARSRHAPSPPAEAQSPVNVQNIRDAQLRSAFSKSLASVSQINALSPARVLEVLSVADAARVDDALEGLSRWLDGFRSARMDGTLRVVGEADG